MSLKCELCGKKVENLKKMGGFRWDPRIYCSRECQLIGDIDVNRLLFIVLIVSLVGIYVFPIPLYLWRKGIKLKKQRAIELKNKQNFCFYCKKEVSDLQKGKNICMSCGNPIHYCDLCQKHVFANEDTLQVEPCGHIFHRNELLDWSEENSVCPKCGEKVELVDYEPE